MSGIPLVVDCYCVDNQKTCKLLYGIRPRRKMSLLQNYILQKASTQARKTMFCVFFDTRVAIGIQKIKQLVCLSFWRSIYDGASLRSPPIFALQRSNMIAFEF